MAAAGGSLLATRHGGFVTPDSVVYLSAAHNLAHGHGFTDFSGQPLNLFAPAYPGMLALGEVVGANVLTVGRFLNAVSFGLVVLLTFGLARRHVETSWMAVGATAIVAVSTPMLRSSVALLTDPAFYAAVLAFLLVVEEYQRRPDWYVRTTAGAAVLVWVAFLLRYAAVSLIVVGAVVIAVTSAKDGARAAARRAGLFIGLASVVPVVWIVRNLRSSTGTALGTRGRSIADSPAKLARDLAVSVRQLVAPDRTDAAALAISLLVVAAIGLLAWSCRRQLAPRLGSAAFGFLPAVVLIVTYTAFVEISHKASGSVLDVRVLLAIWPPVVVVGAWLVDALFRVTRDRGPRWRSVVLGAGLCAAFGLSAAWFTNQVVAGSPRGYDPTSSSSRAVRAALRSVPRRVLVLSNDPWRLYSSTGRQPVFLAPVGVRFDLELSPDQVVRAACTRPTLLIWFAHSPETFASPVSRLQGRDRLDLTDGRRVDGGVAYDVTPKRSASPPVCAEPRRRWTSEASSAVTKPKRR